METRERVSVNQPSNSDIDSMFIITITESRNTVHPSKVHVCWGPQIIQEKCLFQLAERDANHSECSVGQENRTDIKDVARRSLQ